MRALVARIFAVFVITGLLIVPVDRAYAGPFDSVHINGVTDGDREGANANKGEFKENNAKAVMEHYLSIANGNDEDRDVENKESRVRQKIEKVSSDIKNGDMSLDSMDGGADPGEVLGNHLNDIWTMFPQFINPFSDCMDATPITGLCGEFNTSCDCESETTYGQVCVVVDLLFFCLHLELSIYWAYRMPVQKVETNRSYRSGYWFKPFVSIEEIVGDFLLTDFSGLNQVSAGIGLDMARGQRLAQTQMFISNSLGDTVPRNFPLEADVDKDMVHKLKDKMDDFPRPTELKFRNLELAPGAQANAEYHVMKEYTHDIVRSIWGGWKYHYEYKPHDPLIPYFSEGTGILGGRVASFTWLDPQAFQGMLDYELNPMRCMWMNSEEYSDKKKEWGRTPKEIWARFAPFHLDVDNQILRLPVQIPMSARIQDPWGQLYRRPKDVPGYNILPAGDLYNGCLGINGGSWIPYSTRTANTYMAQTAAQNVVKGFKSATSMTLNFLDGSQFYNYELPGQDNQQYDGDKQDDRIMWLRNDRMNTPDMDVGECIDMDDHTTREIEQWEMNYASDKEWADASENQSDDDPFLAAVEWRRFRVCPPNLDVWIGPDTWPE